MKNETEVRITDEGTVAAGIALECSVHFSRGRNGRKRICTGAAPASRTSSSDGRTPKLAKLMALAIHFDGLLREGVVRDYADIARLGHITRARATQIMNLLLLAPDIQEEILFLPKTVAGRDAVGERAIRPICSEQEWNHQRRLWAKQSPRAG